jgi:N-acetylmuramoyl-L-alanine amidase
MVLQPIWGSQHHLFIREVSAHIRGTLGILALLLALVSGAFAAPQPKDAPQMLAARVSATPERARLVIDLSEATQFAIVSLDEPNRIAVDVKASGVPTIAPQEVNGEGIVSSFTTLMIEDERARTELVLSAPVVVQQAYLLDPIGGQPARLVVDLILTSVEDFKARVAADLASSVAHQNGQAAEAGQGAASSEPPPSSEPPATTSSAEPEPAASSEPQAAEPSLVRSGPAVPVEAGTESRPLIVLDPGHGGIDNGASAPSGIHEKDITLGFALQLRDYLMKTGRFDVALTRDDDTYLTLNDRVNLARQNKADLFISLHADTFQQADARGASIYTRDERATDILDAVLAEGENRADIVAGYVQPDVKPAVVSVLVDLMRRQVRQQAYLAAQSIVKAMEPSVALRKFPVRQADFFVLQAPDIPSMLIELGFMSNAEDIANLENQDWRDRVVSAIAEGVDVFFKEIGRK